MPLELTSCLVGRVAVADRFYGCGPRFVVERSGPRLLCGAVFLQVAEEQEGGLRRLHGEVHVLGLHDSGLYGPAPRIADVI